MARFLSLAPAALGLITFQFAYAWTVSNYSGTSVEVKVRETGGLVIQPFQLSNGQQLSCLWSDPNCGPPTSSPTTELVLDITTSDSAFRCTISMAQDGKGEISRKSRSSLGAPVPIIDNLYCESSLNGDLYDYNDPFASGSTNTINASNRAVRFLVSGDPQYNNANIDSNGNTSGSAATADALIGTMNDAIRTTDDIRGVIVNGDITQNARGDNDGSLLQSGDELQAYTRALRLREPWYFEGLGNHDMESTGASSAVDDMREFVRNKPRTTIRTRFGLVAANQDPHYSWDWHDVHVVQLNLMAADFASPEYLHLDPRDALHYLIDDLAQTVGQTGRPVILNHHYGFDDFSTGNDSSDQEWWTDHQRALYWNAIRDYNVIAIFTGHNHASPGYTGWVDLFTPPAISGTNPVAALPRPDGRTCIPTFNAAAIVSGAYLDASLTGSEMRIVRKASTGGTNGTTAVYDIDTLATTGGTHPFSFDCGAPDPDTDGDGISDATDNCSNIVNPLQQDSNGDSIGNACDSDIAGSGDGEEDCFVNFADLDAMRVAFFTDPAAPGWNPHADFDSSGIVNFLDLDLMRAQFFGPPGPSAAGCN